MMSSIAGPLFSRWNLHASNNFSTMRRQPHERSSFTLREMCYSRLLHTLALKTHGCTFRWARLLWHFMTPNCFMKRKRFSGSSSSNHGSTDLMRLLNHVGSITIFSLRTQDCRRLVSEGETMLKAKVAQFVCLNSTWKDHSHRDVSSTV